VGISLSAPNNILCRASNFIFSKMLSSFKGKRAENDSVSLSLSLSPWCVRHSLIFVFSCHVLSSISSWWDYKVPDSIGFFIQHGWKTSV
jgi:hypothetical protein